MDRAVKAVVQDDVSIRKAADMYDVPRSTLGDRVSGQVLPGTSSESIRYLCDEEEEELVTFIMGCASIGYPKTVKDILAIVQLILSSRGVHRTVTYGWWEAFRRRHPNLALRTSSSLSKARALASNRVVLDHYFDLLEETLEENGLKDRPCQIFNMDETGMPLDPKSLKTVHVQGDPNPYTIGAGNKSQITIVGCVSASGQCLPPMVIWDRKTLRPVLTTGEVPGTLYELSSKGWMDQHLFEKWFSRHFLRYAPAVRPLLLLLDGHSSHYSPVTIKLAAEEQVLLFTLPPNTTHFCQSLDKGIFGPLKVTWRRVCHTYLSQNPGQVVHRYVFSQLFSSAWIEAMTIRNIVSGFRTTGIYPLNRDAILLPGEPKKSLSEKTGLSFIPLYTPSKWCKPRCQTFSYEELERFEYHYENGIDPVDQSRYTEWLTRYHPEDSFDSPSRRLSSSGGESDDLYKPLPLQSKLATLHFPSPPSKNAKYDDSVTARVLTTSENIKLLEEKEAAKAEKCKKKTVSKCNPAGSSTQYDHASATCQRSLQNLTGQSECSGRKNMGKSELNID